MSDGAHPMLVMRRGAMVGLHLWREVAVGIGEDCACDDHGLLVSGASSADATTKGSQGSAATRRGASDAKGGP